MKKFLSFLIFISAITHVRALIINEILSNPAGDDGGREWIEVYNDTDNDIDIATLTISIKGGAFVPVTPVSGGTSIAPHGYGIISSTVSGITRFTQDYPTYNGTLFRSSISLVNTGVTSVELKMQGVTLDSVSSYTAAKEGSSYSLLSGTFGQGVPTPGEENKPGSSEEETPATVVQSGTQTTLPQAAPPSADITLYLPKEKVVVAGAPALFSVVSSTHAGKIIDGMTYTWGFGDGGQATGSSTLYRYLYPGRYIAQVEGTNGLIAGSGRMVVRVVAPEISLSPIGVGKYGPYVDITNPNDYDLDISLWKITIDGIPFSFPKHTILTQGTTRFPGATMGFASTTVSSSTLIRLLFQNMDEVLRIIQGKESLQIIQNITQRVATTTIGIPRSKIVTITPRQMVASSSKATTTKILVRKEQKDVRLASFIRSIFSR